jgi:hypothetical protein
MSNLSKRLQNLLYRLPFEAEKSVQQHQHGAILIKNGAPISWGYNVVRGNKTWHAEGDVIRRYLITQGVMNYEKQQCILWRSRKRETS